MMTDLIFVLVISGLATLPFIRALWKSNVEHCRFRLFEVRDDLILHVAAGQLDQQSDIFNHYYQRVNEVLRLTEKMHLEGLIQAVQSGRASKDEAEHYKAELERIADDLEQSTKEIRNTVETYYLVLIDMLLINSNFFSVLYLISKHSGLSKIKFKGWVKKWEPKVAHTYQDIQSESQSLGLVPGTCAS